MKAAQVVPADQLPLLANMSVIPSCLRVCVSAAGDRMGSLGWPREAAWDKDTARRGPKPLQRYLAHALQYLPRQVGIVDGDERRMMR